MGAKGLWDEPATLEEILHRVFDALEEGSKSRKHPCHVGVFATAGPDGPRARCVVLRRFWRDYPRLAFHSHAASPKVSDIEADSRVSWVFYDAEAGIQVRIAGIAALHRSDELEDEQWGRTSSLGKRCYLGDPAGLESDVPTSGLPFAPGGREEDFDAESGRANFLVVATEIRSIDVLELDVRGHRRSLYEWEGGRLVRAVWLTP